MITAKEASIFVATEKQEFFVGKGNSVMEEKALMEEVTEAYKKMIDAKGGAKKMATALGISHHALDNRRYERKGQKMSVEFALKMQKHSETAHFAQVVAKAAGGTFVPLPKVGDVEESALLDKFLTLSIRLGDLSKEYQADIKDGEINMNEWKALEKISGDVHQTLEELMALIKKIQDTKK